MSWTKAETQIVQDLKDTALNTDKNITRVIKALEGDLDTNTPGLSERMRRQEEAQAMNRKEHHFFKIAILVAALLGLVAASDRVYAVVKIISETL